jgi:hypothetical protein
MGKSFAFPMEEQIPPSQQPARFPGQPEITPEQLAELKARAKQLAIQQALAQQTTAPAQPQVIYVRRNLTVAELLLVILLSCGIVTGIQWSWSAISNLLPRIEVKVR